MKSIKGITLIALVITIMVLLILAGVSLSAIFNNEGIGAKSIDAKTSSEIAQEIEGIQISFLQARTDKIFTNDENFNITAEELEN